MPEELEGYKYKGEDFIYLVEINESLARPFDQTGGSHNISNDSIDVATKDRTGSDYGDTSENISLEGDLVYEDPFIPEMKKAIRGKQHIKIYIVDLKNNEAEFGMFKINDFDLEYAHGDFATYSLDADLFGDMCNTELTEIPEGAPALGGIDCEEDNGGVEG